MSKIKVFVSYALIVLTLTACSKVNDFDVVCSAFTKLELEMSKDSASTVDQFHYILSEVKKSLPVTSDAREALEAVLNAVPDERYDIYRYTVQEVTGEAWECEGMRKFISSL